jgi:hypothetical protein
MEIVKNEDAGVQEVSRRFPLSTTVWIVRHFGSPSRVRLCGATDSNYTQDFLLRPKLGRF